MSDNFEFWLVEQFVDLGNETFWHEKGRLYRTSKYHTDEFLSDRSRLVGERDVAKHGGRYRIRVVKEETVFDSGEGE